MYPAGPPVSAFDSFNVPRSRVSVLFVRTSTTASFGVIVTIRSSFAVPDESVNVGVPNEYPTGAGGVLFASGSVGSVTVQTVPVGMFGTVSNEPAVTDFVPVNPIPQS